MSESILDPLSGAYSCNSSINICRKCRFSISGDAPQKHLNTPDSQGTAHSFTDHGARAHNRRPAHPALHTRPPLKFKKLLAPSKIQQILCTGNVCDKETYEYLRTISPDVDVVKGDYDESSVFLSSVTVQHNTVGDVESLGAIARQMDVDVLVSGHTHIFQAIENNNKFLVNPGPASGAWSGVFTSDPISSFALMDIQGNVVVTYVYQLIEGEVRVEKIEWRKEAEVLRDATKSTVMPQNIPSSSPQADW
ncbi:Metallo-dependent phosphatase [Coprinopsis marcescibilis]|nr:Metallo-dependent phosphatase [Coprinopsis marcescibilis]